MSNQTSNYTNKSLFPIYNAISGIGKMEGLPFDITYGIARNMKELKPWFEKYLEARKTAVESLKCRVTGLNAMHKDDYDKLSPDDRKAFEEAFKKIEEEPVEDIKWFTLPLAKFQDREDGKQIEIRADWISVLLDKIIID